jgi:hypothetical protein
MYKKDYILRMVEELAKTIAHILGLKASGKDLKASEVIDETLRSYYKLGEEELLRTDPGELLENLEDKNNPSWAETLAELLYIKADILSGQGKHQESRNMLEKSLSILRFLENNHTSTFSMVRKNRIAEITARLNSIG